MATDLALLQADAENRQDYTQKIKAKPQKQQQASQKK